MRGGPTPYHIYLMEEMHLLIACVQLNGILGEHNKWK